VYLVADRHLFANSLMPGAASYGLNVLTKNPATVLHSDPSARNILLDCCESIL
jgi:hypothetical protein